MPPKTTLDDSPVANSNYPELEKPVFHDNIPGHLLLNVDDHTKYVIQQLSMISQQNEWLIKAAIDTNEQVRHTNGRVRTLEAWQKELVDLKIKDKIQVLDKIFNFWTMIFALLIGASSVIGTILTVLKALKVI